MAIQSARFSDPEHNTVSVVYPGLELSVPTNESNRHFRELMAWAAEGNAIAPYEAPQPGPLMTDAEVLEAATGLTVDQMRDVLGVKGGNGG
jgi:hypothetical protein